jgi:hypothetical protein
MTYVVWYDLGMRRTTVYLPDELLHELHETARRSGRPQADLVREALAVYLPTLARPRPTSLGLGESVDDTVDSENVKAWVRARWEHARTVGRDRPARRT